MSKHMEIKEHEYTPKHMSAILYIIERHTHTHKCNIIGTYTQMQLLYSIERHTSAMLYNKGTYTRM